ncbi:HD domain-containing phosphohydrolase [Thiolapillus sp.]
MSEDVLFVDDEINVLNAYKRALRKRYNLDLASSGKEALQMLKEHGEYAVIVSDMRMPEMNGVQLLSRFRSESPNTIRVMLTGNSDQKTAIAAVNEGDIFRFLNKPCPPQELAETIESALAQHRLVIAEKELLEKTLKGSLGALSEVLSLTNPEAFGHTAEIRKWMCGIVQQLGMEPEWWFEPLAMLCQIGCVILPDEVQKKIAKCAPLTQEEQKLFRQYPEVGAELLSKIPRMEKIAESIRYQEKHYDGSGIPEDSRKGEEIPFGARLLKVVLDFDRALSAGLNNKEAIGRLSWNKKHYDSKILVAMESLLGGAKTEHQIEVDVPALVDGMILHQDITTNDGKLLVRKGQQVSPTVRKLVYNFWENRNIRIPILVSIAAESEAAIA